MTLTTIGPGRAVGPIEAASRMQAAERKRRLFVPVTPLALVARDMVPPPHGPEPEPEPVVEPVVEEVEEAAPTTVAGIITAICRKHGVSRHELMSPSRSRYVIRCRQECCYVLRQKIMLLGQPASLPAIGRFMGGLDHTTVLHAIRQHQKLIDAASTKEGSKA